jgi:hypothetical protein
MANILERAKADGLASPGRATNTVVSSAAISSMSGRNEIRPAPAAPDGIKRFDKPGDVVLQRGFNGD